MISDYTTLKELNKHIQKQIHEHFDETMWLIADISQVNHNRSGHCYLELIERDAKQKKIVAKARATIWAYQYRMIKAHFESITGHSFEAGLSVLIKVMIEFHELYGFSLNVLDIDPTYTLGDMARQRQEIIDRLSDDGIIDMNKGLPLPALPQRIAVISSPTAAGYEDFVDQLANNPYKLTCYLSLFKASMQGDQAVASIIAALDRVFEQHEHFDVVIIIRGGGSRAELSCFDDYELAVNITQFPLPVLTGIGHERDESIADIVAHTALKTPTAVAEFLVDRLAEQANEIMLLKQHFLELSNNLLQDNKQQTERLAQRFVPLTIKHIRQNERSLHALKQEVNLQLIQYLHLRQKQVARMAKALERKSKQQLDLHRQNLKMKTQNLKYHLHDKLNRDAYLIDKQMIQVKNLLQQQNLSEKHRIELLEARLKQFDPHEILSQGYALVSLDGQLLKSTDGLHLGDLLHIQLAKGRLASRVEQVDE